MPRTLRAMSLPPPIVSRSNARVKALRTGFDGKASQPGESLAIEGETLLAEAIQAGVRVQTIFVREGSERVLESPHLRSPDPVPTVVLSRDVFAGAVDTASPQGVAALIAIPDLRAMKKQNRHGVVLVLEAMQDPGNLGTLIRTSEAFGVQEVLLAADTVNPWNPKAIRASAGSVFRVPIRRVRLREAKAEMADQGMRLFAAVVEANGAISCTEADLSTPCALMIGNEGAGLSAEALALADVRVHIPCRIESLNAATAGSVLLYESMRQRRLSGQSKGPGE